MKFYITSPSCSLCIHSMRLTFWRLPPLAFCACSHEDGPPRVRKFTQAPAWPKPPPRLRPRGTSGLQEDLGSESNVGNGPIPCSYRATAHYIR